MKLTIIISIFIIFSNGILLGQVSIRGTVFSIENSVPLSNATVYLKASVLSAQTDSEGGFTVTLTSIPDTLHVSHVGYISKSVAVAAEHQNLEIYMERDHSVLQEAVVNTGYYNLPRERVTGSFEHVDNKLLNRSVGPDILSRLEGLVSGVQFVNPNGTEPNGIRIRGLNTIESNETPLIVVDDFPYEGDIGHINPNDVESITVLKDAAAASIWGARAGNGVIVITTKKGRYEQKTQVSINSNVTVGQKPDLYYSQSWLPSDIVMGIEKDLFNRGVFADDPSEPVPAYVELLFKQQQGAIDDAEFVSQESMMKHTDIRSEALKHLYRQSLNQQTALTINGGGEKYNYYISGGWDDINGDVRERSNSRLNLSMQNTYRPLKNMELSAGIWFSHRTTHNNGLDIGDLKPRSSLNVSPYTQLIDDDGNSLPVVHERSFSYYEEAVANGLLDWHYRPLDERRLVDRNQVGTEYRLNTGLRYNIPKAVDIELKYQYVQSETNERTLYDKESYYARNLVNRFTLDDGTRIIPWGAILDGTGARNTNSHFGRLQVNTDRHFGTAHQLSALGGAEIRQQMQHSYPGYRIYGYDPERLTGTASYNYTETYRVRPSGSSRLPTPSVTRGEHTNRFLSYFGNAAYTYDNRYSLSASLRWDGSNLFGVKTNQKGVPLWSVGSAWDVGRELFWKISWVSTLRLRATYGSSGNVNKRVSAFPVVAYLTDPVTDLPYAQLESFGNPSLRWEQVKTFNLGADFGLLGSRLEGAVEYYIKNASDLIGDDFLAPSTGVMIEGTTNKINYANMRTHGVDLQLHTSNLTGAFNWQSSLIVSYVKNKITRFAKGRLNDITYYLLGSVPHEGRSRDVIYAFPWYGLDHENGMPLVLTEGQLTQNYEDFIMGFSVDNLPQAGVTVPPYYGSLRNTFSYAGLELSFNIMWKSGYVFRRKSISPAEEYDIPGNYHMDYLKRWKKPGDEIYTVVPAAADMVNGWLNTSYTYSQALITPGDHIRLQDVRLSYGLNRGQCKWMPVNHVRIYAYARNLGVIWKANENGIDPDYPAAQFPAPRTVAFGLQIGF